ncbi:hypothetical protein C1H46_003456 [Malus baccata]|uniref:Uncharacterized protein n=1 Tax=Malus baccata TaxID=106549 RepID=A0A540NJS3_MALBA|nr:hypothetical protein C1H46_003456 [Malus baccata]
MKLDALHSASSSKQQGRQHQLRHFSHHASNDEETSMTAIKRLAGHEARRFTFCLKLQAARASSKAVNTSFVTLATMLQTTKKLQ